MLKPQDCIILIKLLAHPDKDWKQRELAKELSISLSEINAGIHRLIEAELLRQNKNSKLSPNIRAAEEFLISSVKYLFPVKLGEYTRGVPAGIAAPLFHDKIVLGNEPIPVWPDAFGGAKGVTLKPIYPSIVEALREHPDPQFYDFLVIVDVIRSGRARERNIAIKLLKDRLTHGE